MNTKTNAVILASVMIASLLCVTLCIADESDATGTEYFVDSAATDGGDGSKSNPWKSIDYNTVKDGDTVNVTGTFDHIPINRFINIVGDDAITNGITFHWSNTDGLLADTEHDDGKITISGLEITGMINDTRNSDDTTDYSSYTVEYRDCDFTAQSTHMSLCVYKGYNLVIDGCDFRFENNETQKDNTYAIFVQNLSGLTVRDSTFDGFSRFINADTISGTMTVENCEFEDLVPVEPGEFEARAIQIAGDMTELTVDISGNSAVNDTKTTDSSDQGIFFSVHDSSIGNPTVTVENNYVKGFDSLIQYASKDTGGIPKIEITGGDNICLDSSGNAVEQPVKAESNESTADLVKVTTAEDLLTIDSETELKRFADMANSGVSFEGETITLNADIPLTEGWTPIGSPDRPFMGTFDGQNHKISNIAINDSNMEYAGLFGYLSTPGTIKDVTIDNVDITAKSYVGALVGSAHTGTVSGCSVTGNIQINGNYMVGGLVGSGYADISNCHVSGDTGSKVAGTYQAADLEGDNIGGLIGFMGEGNTVVSRCSVENISVEGTRKVGGIVGSAYTNNTIQNCSVMNTTIASNATPEYIGDNSTSAAIGGIVGLYTVNGNGGGELTGCTVSGIALESENDGVQMGYVTGGQRGSSSIVAPENVTQNDNKLEGENTGSNVNTIIRDGAVYQSFEQALEGASGEVVITVYGDYDLTAEVADSTASSVSIDLSSSDIKSLTIDGANGASITTGVDGHGIDGPTYCPVLRFTLPSHTELTIENLVFQNDLYIDNTGNEVTYTGCIFHGAISTYPKATKVTFDDNTFSFYGTASEFYTNNAYPVWFKISGLSEGDVFDLVFTNNDVTGYRGVHIENRPSGVANIEVSGNTFNLIDSKYNNKTTTLQLVDQMNGKIIYTDNKVNAYMAICLYNGVNLTGTIEYSRNTLSEGCKDFGTNEWSSDVPEGFVESLIQAKVGNIYYPTIQTAIQAASAGSDKTVTLVNDVQLSEKLTITADDITLDLADHMIAASADYTNNDGNPQLVSVECTLVEEEFVKPVSVTIQNGTLRTGSSNSHALNLYGADAVLRNLTLDVTGSRDGFKAPLIVNGSDVKLGGDVTFIGGSYYSIDMDSTIGGVSEVSLTTEEDTMLAFNDVSIGIANEMSSTDGEKATIAFGPNTGYTYDTTPFTLLRSADESSVDDSESTDPIDRVENPLYTITIKVNVTPDSIKVTSQDGTITYEPETDGTYLLAEGSYVVIVTKDGYDTVTKSFTVPTADGVMNVEMNPTTIDPEPEPGPGGDDTPVVPPIIDDDDDYVPLPPQIVVKDDGGDDETVKVAACAAAAVAAAIIALILVAEYRKN